MSKSKIALMAEIEDDKFIDEGKLMKLTGGDAIKTRFALIPEPEDDRHIHEGTIKRTTDCDGTLEQELLYRKMGIPSKDSLWGKILDGK
jgi:hypothetical protein